MNQVNSSLRTDEVWFGELRDRFLEIARRRVHSEGVEDVVQEALAIVHRKGAESPGAVDGRALLPWCFQVLRHVVGNYYQRERTRRRAADDEEGALASAREMSRGSRSQTPLEALEELELSRLLETSIGELATRDGDCARLLRETMGRAETKPEPRMSGAPRETKDSAFYVRAFRCRQKLKAILLRRGFLA